MEGRGYFSSALRCCIPCLWPGMEGIRGRRRERIAELEKNVVLLMLAGSKADGQSQMDALGWQVSHNSYCSGFWLPSPVNSVAWSALSLSLSPFYRFFPIWTSSCGWLLISQPFACSTVSLKMAEKLSERWREKADNERGALREGDAEDCMFLGPCPCNECDWERCQWGSHGAIVTPHVQWGCVPAV